MGKWISKHRSLISITLLIIALILLGGGLMLKATNKISELNPLVAIIGCLCTTVGLTMTLYERDSNKPKRGFEPVIENKRKNKYYHLPTRGTKNSAGYDFYSPNEYLVKPNEIVKIWTDIKAYMQSDEFLMLNVRSSMGGKFMLANTVGVIDSDYYSNPDNDGNICIMLKNISNEVQYIKRDDRIVQGIYMQYLTIDNDNVNKVRNSGMGSSGQ